jgi:carboxylate-amine ligase
MTTANAARYLWRFPLATTGSIPCGLHVHVAVSGAERALSIYNAVRGYLPELAALSANSPYLAGKDTGLASARRTLNDAFQRTGVPPAFDDWSAFGRFVLWGQMGRIFDAQHLWWENRPSRRSAR